MKCSISVYETLEIFFGYHDISICIFSFILLFIHSICYIYNHNILYEMYIYHNEISRKLITKEMISNSAHGNCIWS